MTSSLRSPCRLLFSMAAISSLALSACASKPDRRGPPSDRQGQGPARSSGTFVKPVGLLFTGMDIDRDAVVTRAELNAGIQSEWTGFDRKPSGAAFSFWSKEKLGSTDAFPTFLMFDRDFNGVVSEEEFSKRLQDEFTKLDKNRNEILERSEMIVAFAAPQGQSRPNKREGGQKRGGGGEGGGGGRPSR